MVNDQVINAPAFKLKSGDIIKPVAFEKIHLREGFVLPEWLDANVKERYVKINRLPVLDEFSEDVNVQLIIEFYSR